MYQQVKAEHKHPAGLLQTLSNPEWKWEYITMDFVVGLPKTQQGCDVVWVIVDGLMKSVHFLQIRTNYNLNKLVELFIKEIVRLHGALVSIMSNRDPRFTSLFWPSLQEALGTKLKFSTTFHPQMDGQSKHTI